MTFDTKHDIIVMSKNKNNMTYVRCEVERDTEQPLAVVHTVEILGQLKAGFIFNFPSSSI